MANGAINAINRTAAATDNSYVRTDLGIRASNDETKNLISTTFGQYIKNNLEAFWGAVGLDPNVNIAYQKIMSDPNAAIDMGNNRVAYPHSAVGNLHAFNEVGNPRGGVFTMQTIA